MPDLFMKVTIMTPGIEGNQRKAEAEYHPSFVCIASAMHFQW